MKAIQQSRVNFTTRKPRDTARTVPRETMQLSMRKNLIIRHQQQHVNRIIIKYMALINSNEAILNFTIFLTKFQNYGLDKVTTSSNLMVLLILFFKFFFT